MRDRLVCSDLPSQPVMIRPPAWRAPPRTQHGGGEATHRERGGGNGQMRTADTFGSGHPWRAPYQAGRSAASRGRVSLGQSPFCPYLSIYRDAWALPWGVWRAAPRSSSASLKRGWGGGWDSGGHREDEESSQLVINHARALPANQPPPTGRMDVMAPPSIHQPTPRWFSPPFLHSGLPQHTQATQSYYACALRPTQPVPSR